MEPIIDSHCHKYNIDELSTVLIASNNLSASLLEKCRTRAIELLPALDHNTLRRLALVGVNQLSEPGALCDGRLIAAVHEKNIVVE